MPRKYRALSSEFRDCLSKHDAWPKHENYLDYMADHHGGIARSSLTHLRKGSSALEKASFGLIEMYCTNAKELKPGARKHFIHYLKQINIAQPDLAKTDDVFNLLCEAETLNPRDSDGNQDHLITGFRDPWSLFKLPGRKFVDKSQVADQNTIPNAIEWMFYHVAQSVSIPSIAKNLQFDHAIQIAEDTMKISITDYQKKAIEWSSALPETVRLGMGKEQPVGVTIVLPLKKQIYEQVRDGKIESSDCTPQDFEIPSSHLIIECCAERVGIFKTQAGNVTLPMFASLSTQLACMSELDRKNTGDSLNLLSFAGIPEGKMRLAKQGFKPTGTNMPNSGVELMERFVKIDKSMDLDAIAVALLSWISRYGRRNTQDCTLRI